MSAVARVIKMNRHLNPLPASSPRKMPTVFTVFVASVNVVRTVLAAWLKLAWLAAMARESLRFVARVAAAVVPGPPALQA